MSGIRSELADSLGRLSIFAGLSEAIVAELAAGAVRQSYQTGEIVFLEGEIATSLYYLESGWLKVVKISSEGREQVLRFLGPNETFNQMGVFAHRPNPATAMALEPASVWLISRDAITQILTAHPDVALRVIENMADRVVDLVTLVAELSLHTVEARLARLLLQQADEDVVQRRRWTTQAELAARLGTVPDVLSRALRSLADDGIIQVERQRIRILDREKLVTKAGLAE